MNTTNQRNAVAWWLPTIIAWQRARVIAAGVDPGPDRSKDATLLRFARMPEVSRITGLSKSVVYNELRAGRFPKQVQLTGRNAGAS